MFSSHMPRINTVPREYIYLGVGVVLVVSLLIAIASVASGEVRKAAMRDSSLASQRSAAAYCVETRRGVELNTCLKQAWRDSSGDPVMADASGNAPSRTVAAADTNSFGRSAAVANVSAQGFIPASFGNLR